MIVSVLVSVLEKNELLALNQRLPETVVASLDFLFHIAMTYG